MEIGLFYVTRQILGTVEQFEFRNEQGFLQVFQLDFNILLSFEICSMSPFFLLTRTA